LVLLLLLLLFQILHERKKWIRNRPVIRGALHDAIEDQAEWATRPELDRGNGQHGDEGKQLFQRYRIDGQDLGAVLDNLLQPFLPHKEIIEDALTLLGDLRMAEDPGLFQEAVVAA